MAYFTSVQNVMPCSSKSTHSRDMRQNIQEEPNAEYVAENIQERPAYPDTGITNTRPRWGRTVDGRKRIRKNLRTRKKYFNKGFSIFISTFKLMFFKKYKIYRRANHENKKSARFDKEK